MRSNHDSFMKNTSCSSFILFSFLFFCVSQAYASPWPAWRGPEGTGVTKETKLPLQWDRTNHVRWKTPLPDRGNSTPVIWGGKVFVTQALEKDNQRTLMCFDRTDGKLRWHQDVAWTAEDPSHETNPHCAASPVTDGERVIVSHGSAGLICYDLDGKELWRRDLGTQRHIWGYAASPVIQGNLCYLNFGPGERTFLIAVDKRTGEKVWQVDDPGGHSGEKKPGAESPPWVGSWSTPVFIPSGGSDSLVMSWPNRVVAFDPASGKERWTCRGLNPLVYTSILQHNGVVVAMGGFGGMALAVKTGGTGDVTDTHRLWHHPKTKQRIGSGVIAGDHIYILNDPGVAECFELSTGKRVWEERLKGPGAKADSWSSMVLAGDRIYVINQSGDSFVLKASPQFEVLATNPLGETCMASIAPSDGELFIRTYKHLWCIGEK